MNTTIRSVNLKVGFISLKSVQPLICEKAVGQAGCEGSLRLPAGQVVQAVAEILRNARINSPIKCPSGSLYLKELKMNEQVDFLWLPIDRVALLMKVSVKTIRRMIKAKQLTALMHQIPTKVGKTYKTFILADDELFRLEYMMFRQTIIRPDLWFEEEIVIGESIDDDDSNRFRSVFLVFLDNELYEKTDKEQVKKVIRKHNRNSRGMHVSIR
jgi:hypothetical protein